MGIIGWEHVKFRLTATDHYPAHVFQRALNLMEQAWTEIWSDPLLPKLSVNAMIGTWCLDKSFDYKVISSAHDGDCPPEASKHVFHYTGGEVNDFITKNLPGILHEPQAFA